MPPSEPQVMRDGEFMGFNPDVMWCVGVIDCVVTVNVIIPPPSVLCRCQLQAPATVQSNPRWNVRLSCEIYWWHCIALFSFSGCFFVILGLLGLFTSCSGSYSWSYCYSIIILVVIIIQCIIGILVVIFRFEVSPTSVDWTKEHVCRYEVEKVLVAAMRQSMR